MADIPLQFPNFANALAAGSHARYSGAQARLAAAEEQRRLDAQPFVGAAMQGDPAAMAKVASGDPKTAVAISTALGRMDANQRAQTKEQGEYAARAANAILQADPKDRATIYADLYAEGQRRGYKMTLPPTYSPQLDSILRSHRAAGQSIDDWFKQNEGTPQPIGPGASAAPAQGGPAAAIAGIESSGQPNGGYGAVGPVANDKGQRAYGKYQVMDFNIGPWTQEVLGKAMSPQEFVANPQAQDAVFNAKFGQYVQKYGSPQAAARAWFAGEGGMNNPNASDVNGMTVARYEGKFNAGLNGQAAPGVPGPVAAPPGNPPVQVAQGDAGRGDGSGTPVPPADPRAAVRGVQLPPGARLMGVKGVPVVKDGTVMVQMPDGSIDFVPLPQRKEPGNTPPAGPFGGTGMDAQAHNLVLQGDPSSPEYAAAYAHLAAPKVQIDPATGQAVQIKPDMSWARPPASGVGSKGVEAQAVPGIKRTPEAFKKLETEVNSVNAAIENFRKVIGEAGGGSFSAFINNPQSVEGQKILGAFNALKTALRSEAFVNTGVLQPAEMTMLDNMLLAPTTLRGLFATPEAYGSMLNEIQQFIGNKIAGARSAYGVEGGESKAAPKTPGAAAPKTKQEYDELPSGTQFTAPDGSIRVKP